jgi:hypothetical protein
MRGLRAFSVLSAGSLLLLCAMQAMPQGGLPDEGMKSPVRPGYPGLPDLTGLPPCEPDQVHIRVAGTLESASLNECPAAPRNLSHPGWSALYFFDIAMDEDRAQRESGYPGFTLEHFDRQRRVCTYLGCISVQVARQGIAFRNHESCIGPFTGGTTVPSESAPACPAAVKLGGQYGAFRRQVPDGRCCYGWAGPVPPAASGQ